VPLFVHTLTFVNRAETYLRLLAERDIRNGHGADGLRQAAALLTDAGAVPEDTAEAIVESADLAFAVRSGQAQAFGFRRAKFPDQELADQPWQVIPAKQVIAGRTGPIQVGSVVRTARSVFVVAMRRTGEPVSLEDVASLTATDEAGGRYAFTLASPVALELDPVPPPEARQLTIYENQSERIRLDLTVTPDVVTSTVAGSIAERVLIRRAEAILTAVANGRRPGTASLGAPVAVFQEAGLLPADSQVPGQLAALAQHLGLSGSRLPTPTELPEPWRSALTQFARLRQPSVREDAAVTPLAVPLPGMHGVITGLSRSRLYLVMQEMPRRSPWSYRTWSHGPRPALPTAPEVPLSVWAHDDTDHWHLVAADDFRAHSTGLVSAALAWHPPLGRDVTSVEITVTDSTAQITINAEVQG
jgi:hypothetical protein